MKTDIVAILREEGIDMIDRGNHYSGLCPLHKDNNPSLVVFKNTPARFICFGCGEKGDAIDFIRARHGMSYQGALKYLKLGMKFEKMLIKRDDMLEHLAKEEDHGIDIYKKYGAGIKEVVQVLTIKKIVKGIHEQRQRKREKAGIHTAMELQ